MVDQLLLLAQTLVVIAYNMFLLQTQSKPELLMQSRLRHT